MLESVILHLIRLVLVFIRSVILSPKCVMYASANSDMIQSVWCIWVTMGVKHKVTFSADSLRSTKLNTSQSTSNVGAKSTLTRETGVKSLNLPRGKFKTDP